MRKFVRINVDYITKIIETEATKGTKGLLELSQTTFNKCYGYSTKMLCDAAKITPNNFQAQFKSHIEFKTIKKIGKFWYINPDHLFCGDIALQNYYADKFNKNELKHNSELTLEEHKQIQNNKDKGIAETKSNKDKLIKELQEEIKLLKEQSKNPPEDSLNNPPL